MSAIYLNKLNIKKLTNMKHSCLLFVIFEEESSLKGGGIYSTTNFCDFNLLSDIN